MNTTMCERRNTLQCINRGLDTAEEKLTEFEDIAIETIHNETHRKIKIKKGKNRVLVTSEKTTEA